MNIECLKLVIFIVWVHLKIFFGITREMYIIVVVIMYVTRNGKNEKRRSSEGKQHLMSQCV